MSMEEHEIIDWFSIYEKTLSKPDKLKHHLNTIIRELETLPIIPPCTHRGYPVEISLDHARKALNQLAENE
jgi:hypothetical protein